MTDLLLWLILVLVFNLAVSLYFFYQLSHRPETRKRKNDEARQSIDEVDAYLYTRHMSDNRYSWLIAPRIIDIRPVHQWRDEDERKRFFALMRETTVPEERPQPFATTRSKK